MRAACFAAVTAAVTMLAAAGCADREPRRVPAGAQHGGDGGRAIAWVDRPAPKYVAPPPPVPPHDAPPCRAGELAVSRTRYGAALGNALFEVYLVNRGARTCLVSGYPTLSAVTARGTVPIRIRHGGYFPQPGPAADLRPGDVVAANFGGTVDCALGVRGVRRIYPHLRLGLPAGGALDIHSTFDTVCGVSVSPFGVPSAAYVGPAPSPLQLRMNLPTVLHPGVLGYTITLTNPTAHSYSLNPCPSYDEYVAASAVDEQRYYLNCDTVRSIPAHSSVRYRMRLRVPAALSGQDAKFGWILQGDRGPAAATMVHVA